MSKPVIFYEFAGLRLFPESQQLEILSSGSKINLSPTHCRFLLALAQKPRQTVSYEELRLAVWTQSKELDASLKRLIHTTKGDLIKTLRHAKMETDFIKNFPGEGYRLNAEVLIQNNDEEPYLPAAKPLMFETQAEIKISSPERHRAFIYSVSFFYGLLFWAALLLESAYKFEDFQSKIFWLAVPLTLWNGAMMFTGLALTQEFLRKSRRNALFFGVISLIFGAFVSCLIIGLVLPNEPITAARFQTQPALGAYIKNVWMYFLPLGICLILLPFYAVCGRQYEKKVFTVPPSLLLGFWLLALIYSFVSTFYLLDNLLPLENHGLFVIVVILRFVIYFGLGLAVLIWYFSRSKDISAPETRFSAKQQIALLFILSAIGLDCL